MQIQNIATEIRKQNIGMETGKHLLQGQRAINILVQENMMLKRQLSQIFNFNPHLINQFQCRKPVLIQHQYPQQSANNNRRLQQRFSIATTNKDQNQNNQIQNSYRQKITKLKSKKHSSHQRKFSQCKSPKVVFQLTNCQVNNQSNRCLQSNSSSRYVKNHQFPVCSQANSKSKILNQQISQSKSNNIYKELQNKVKILSKHLSNNNKFETPGIVSDITSRLQHQNKHSLSSKETQIKQLKLSTNFKINQNSINTNRKQHKDTFQKNEFEKQKFVPKPPSVFNLHKDKLESQNTGQNKDINKKLIIQNNTNLQCANNKPMNTFVKQLRGNIYLQDELEEFDIKQKNGKKMYKEQFQKGVSSKNKDQKQIQSLTLRKNFNNKNEIDIKNDSQVVSLQYFMKQERQSQKEQRVIKKKLINQVYVNQE